MKRKSASNQRKPHLEKPMRKHIAFCFGDTDFDTMLGGADASKLHRYHTKQQGFEHPVHKRAIRKRVKREEEGWRN